MERGEMSTSETQTEELGVEVVTVSDGRRSAMGLGTSIWAKFKAKPAPWPSQGGTWDDVGGERLYRMAKICQSPKNQAIGAESVWCRARWCQPARLSTTSMWGLGSWMIRRLPGRNLTAEVKEGSCRVHPSAVPSQGHMAHLEVD